MLLFGFLHWTDAQANPASQSYPDNYVPPNLATIKKVIDVTFTHNLPNPFDLREEDDYTWSYFTTGMVHHSTFKNMSHEYESFMRTLKSIRWIWFGSK